MITVISGKNKAMNFCDGICKDGTLCRYKSKITDTIGKHFCGIHVLQGVFEDCCICMDAICEQPVTVTNCKHIFHTKCLEKWTTNYNTNCPLCRAQIVKKQDVIYKVTIEEEAFIISLLQLHHRRTPYEPLSEFTT